MTDFFRFPHIPHVAWLGEIATREDKVLSTAEVAELLDGPVVVEEKLDGANLGFSIGPNGGLQAQNRGAYLQFPCTGQFAHLDRWLFAHENCLFDNLGEHLIAFGEWCAARHSLDYLSLPDWWLMFDVYDKRTKRFWSTRRRDALANKLKLPSVPCLFRGQIEFDQLKELMLNQHSRYREGVLEGVVIRREDDDWLTARGKLVRPDFLQNIESHWRSRAIEWNHLSTEQFLPVVQR